ncbi:uncharacterized protein LOC144777875 isoform X2 [Lissotriton helveticus]
MMGILPETSRLRTSVSLVIMLLIGICFVGFTYWTHLNHSQSYQRKIAFLERTISKLSKADDEADGREADFQRELRKHKQGMQHMNAMAQQEIMRLKYECKQDQDRFTQTIEGKNAVIKEKEDLMSSMKQAYLKMQQDMAVFQKNQSQLLEKFTLQSEKMEMLVRLKDRCYSQMNSISKSIAVPSLPSDVAAAGRSSKTQDKVKGKDTNSETPKNIASPATVVKGDDQPDVLRPNDKEEKKKQGPMDEAVNEAVARNQPTQPLNDVPDVLKPNDKEEKKKKQEPMDEEVNKAVTRNQPTQPLNDVPEVLKPNNKEKKKEQEPMDEEVNKDVERLQPTQPLNDVPDVLKPNDKEKKKEQEPMDEEVNEAVEEKDNDLKDWNAKADVKEKQQAQPLEDELDLLEPNKKEEAKNEEEPF